MTICLGDACARKIAVRHEIMGRDGQKGVGRNHAFRAGDDAEAVVVRVIGQDEVIVQARRVTVYMT